MTRYNSTMKEILEGIRQKQTPALLKAPIQEAKKIKEEDGEEVSMFNKQIEFIKYAADEMKEWLAGGADLPEWFESKLAAAHSSIRELHAYMEGDKRDNDGENDMATESFVVESHFKPGDSVIYKGMKGEVISSTGEGSEEVYKLKCSDGKTYDVPVTQIQSAGQTEEMDEGVKLARQLINPSKEVMVVKMIGKQHKVIVIDKKDLEKYMKQGWGLAEDVKEAKTDYQIYHKDYSSAVQHALANAKSRGFNVDMDDYERKVAFGPRKPSAGKTNSFIIDTDHPRKKLHMQVYNMDNRGYELNMYIESKEVEEGAFSELQIAAKELASYAVKSGGIDKSDFMKAAAMMKTGKVQDLVKFTKDLDTEPRDKIIDMVKGAVGKSATEKLFNVSIREQEEPAPNDAAKDVEQMRDDQKKTRIAQLQLQIAKAQQTINRLNQQDKNTKKDKGEQ